jgi:hypothetical protein
MIDLRIGLSPKLLGQNVAIFLVELRHNPLLGVEARVALLVGDLRFELISGRVPHLLVPSLLAEVLVENAVHEEGLNESEDLMIQEEVSKFMRDKKSDLLLLHACELEDRYRKVQSPVEI